MPRAEYIRLSVEEKIKIANEHLVDRIPTSVLAEKYKCNVRNINKYISNVKNNKTMYKHGKKNKLNRKYFNNTEKIKIANENLQEGTSLEDLAIKYNCKTTTIKKYIDRVSNNNLIDNRLKINRNSSLVFIRLSLEEKIKIASEHLFDDIKQKDLAKKYNCNISSISYYIRNYHKNKEEFESGKPKIRRKACKKFSDEEKVKIANEHLVDGVSYKDLAIKYHCTDVTVRNHIKAVKSGKVTNVDTIDQN